MNKHATTNQVNTQATTHHKCAQYTQLKFKFDPLMKQEILGSIPNEVSNLWTLTQSTIQRDSLF